jgi:ribonuclease T1
MMLSVVMKLAKQLARPLAPRVALLAALPIVLIALASPADARRSADTAEPQVDSISVEQLPPEARQTLARIHAGGPFPYARDGVRFENFEGRLPPRARGTYHEYTVRTPGRRNRGERRIIVGDGAFYYTDDHYETFRRILE